MGTIGTRRVSTEKGDVSRSFHADRTRLSIFQFLNFTFQFSDHFADDLAIGIRCIRRGRETMNMSRGVVHGTRQDLAI